MVYMVFGSIAITCCPALALFRTAGMQNLPTKAEVLVLDFDNCLILDPETREGSEDLKKSAWFRVFPYEPGELSQAIDEAYRQIAGGKGDRRDVVRFVLQRCGVLQVDEEEITRYCDSFNTLVQEGILQIGVSQEIRDTLAELNVRRIPLYINSASPAEFVEQSLKALRIFHHFKGIYGTPWTKEGNLRKIIHAEGVDPQQVIFVDDSAIAWNIAQAVGCQFIGIHTKANTAWHNGDTPFLVIRKLSELLEFF